MDSKKLAFANDVVSQIIELCKLIFNVKSAKEIPNILGISRDQLEVIIQKMIMGLPKDVFKLTSTNLVDEVKHLCAQEFIFFQVQENKNDPAYRKDVENFITFLSRDILYRILHDQKTSMKEDKNG